MSPAAFALAARADPGGAGDWLRASGPAASTDQRPSPMSLTTTSSSAPVKLTRSPSTTHVHAPSSLDTSRGFGTAHHATGPSVCHGSNVGSLPATAMAIVARPAVLAATAAAATSVSWEGRDA